MAVLQSGFTVYPERGFVGMLAEPSGPHLIDVGPIYVPSTATRLPRPGDAVYYDTTQNSFRNPTDAAGNRSQVGIIVLRQDDVGAEDASIQYANGDQVQVLRQGSIWLAAGGAIEYDSLITWSESLYTWSTLAVPTSVSTLIRYPAACADIPGPAANGDVFRARIGYGRVY